MPNLPLDPTMLAAVDKAMRSPGDFLTIIVHPLGWLRVYSFDGHVGVDLIFTEADLFDAGLLDVTSHVMSEIVRAHS